MSEATPGTAVTLPAEPAPAAPALPPPRCQNCAAELAGPYCATCGQRHDPHMHSLGHFVIEATENLTHADSRVWRTLWPLLAKPGFLTREFFNGRRSSYLPPFRLYLVVSVLFFLIAALVPNGEREVPVVFIDGSPNASESAKEAACEKDLTYEGPGEGWIQPLLVDACRKTARDDGRALKEAFTHNIPRALFVFLPLLAAAMMLLYWRPRRFYVEHLLFFIHTHSFVFVAFALYLGLAAVLPWDAAAPWLLLALLVYVPWYLLRAMRVVYGQSRRRTLAKFVALSLIYVLFGVAMLLFTLAVSVVAL